MLKIALVLEVALVEHKHMTLIHPWLSQLHPRKKHEEHGFRKLPNMGVHASY